MSKIVFIQSLWHQSIVDEFKKSFTSTIRELSQEAVEIEYVEAPGVVEVPLLAKMYAKSGRYDAVVVSGLVVDHGIYRHEFVAQSVLGAIMQVQLETETPVIYGILTPQDFLSEGRESFFHSHFKIKGEEAARACSVQLANLRAIAA